MKVLDKIITVFLFCMLSIAVNAQNTHWSVNAYDYRYDMTAYFTLEDDGVAVAELDKYEVAAFVGDECRGVGRILTQGEIQYGYLRIHSNNESGETVTFKVYNSANDEEYTVKDVSIIFQSQSVIGMPSSPFILPISASDMCTISVVSSDETKGAVEGGTTVKYGEEVTVKATANEGYHFVSWAIGENVVSTDATYTFIAESDVILVANFAPNQYTMTFVLDNGEEDIVMNLEYGSELVAPTGFQKTGFTFKGWDPEVPATVPASDMTFTAQWERASYVLTWDVDGVKTEVALAYGDPIIRPEDPVKEGYTFAGWTPEVAETMPAEDVTYTATWTIIQYTITYDLDGGALEEDVSNPASYTIESEDFTLANPTREGYVFVGWVGTGLEEPTQVVTIARGSTGDRSYTAKWDVKKYTMTFVLDNGEEDIVMNLEYGSELVAPTGFQKTGFTFIGWDPEVPATVPASDMTFTAQWERASYVLTWDIDGVKTEVALAYGDPIIKPEDPVKEGYTFAGWTPEVAETMPAEDVTYTATWTIIQYTITYDLDGGSLEDGVTNPASYTIESEDFTLANPTREGYVFVGWVGTGLEEPTQVVTIARGSTGDRSYTAKWDVRKYTMTFVLDNGEEDIVMNLEYGSELVAPTGFQKTGFTFKGWDPEVPATVPASDMTFTAQWERASYVLTWDVDGVKTEVALAYGDPIIKPEDPVKDGYTFAGWTPEVAETMPAEDVTYTATWTIIQYTITYDLDGGSLEDGVTNPASYTIESEDFTLANPTREGYVFVGWVGTGLEEPSQVVTIAKGSTGDRSYTAKWDVRKYAMTFVLDNGEEDIVMNLEYGSELVAPTGFQKTGFTFKGWDPEVPATVPASDMTFTAQWERASYVLTWDVDGVKTEVALAYGDPIIKPEDPVKDGYTFAGWTPEVAETMPAEDVTYTATWTVIQYTITYDLDGGNLENGATNPASYTIETEDFTLANPTREGYAFAGWVGTGLEEPTQVVTIAMGSTGDRSYTAKWDVRKYTMTFVLDNGEEDIVMNLEYGSELVAPTGFQKTGFTFKGWDPEVPATVPACDMTFTAQWERHSYVLTWDIDGVKTEVTLAYGDPIIKPEDPMKEGYTFAGWTPEVAETMPAEDVTYTATWTVIQYTITYDLDGGSLEDGVTNPASYTIESEDFTLANPTREGYVFVGWVGTGLEEPSQVVTIAKGSTGDRSYTAKWDIVTGINTISSIGKHVDVYDLQGRKLRSNIPVSMLSEELPSGIYIIGGKKVAITK